MYNYVCALPFFTLHQIQNSWSVRHGNFLPYLIRQIGRHDPCASYCMFVHRGRESHSKQDFVGNFSYKTGMPFVSNHALLGSKWPCFCPCFGESLLHVGFLIVTQGEWINRKKTAKSSFIKYNNKIFHFFYFYLCTYLQKTYSGKQKLIALI